MPRADDPVARAAPPMSQAKARLAGLFYLGTIVAGIFAEVVARSSVVVRGDGSATAANIVREIGIYRAGEAADILMLCCYLAVTALLYELFACTSRQLSFVAAAFSLTGIAVLASDGLLHMAPLSLIDGTMSHGLPTPQRDALIGLSLDLHGKVYGISLIFFGIYCVLIGYLAIRSALLPRIIGVLMIVGGLVHILAKFTAILSPEIALMLPRVMNLAPLVGEAAFASWLLLFGLRRPSPKS